MPRQNMQYVTTASPASEGLRSAFLSRFVLGVFVLRDGENPEDGDGELKSNSRWSDGFSPFGDLLLLSGFSF